MNAENNRSRFADTLRDYPAEVVQEHPVGVSMALFGIGVAVGMLLVHSAEPSSHRTRREANGFSHRLGMQVLEAIRTSLPDAIAQHLPK